VSKGKERQILNCRCQRNKEPGSDRHLGGKDKFFQGSKGGGDILQEPLGRKKSTTEGIHKIIEKMERRGL